MLSLLGTECFTYINSLNSHNNSEVGIILLSLLWSDKKTKIQRVEVTCPWSHSLSRVEPCSKFRSGWGKITLKVLNFITLTELTWKRYVYFGNCWQKAFTSSLKRFKLFFRYNVHYSYVSTLILMIIQTQGGSQEAKIEQRSKAHLWPTSPVLRHTHLLF